MRNLNKNIVVLFCVMISIAMVGCDASEVHHTIVSDESKLLCGANQCYTIHAWVNHDHIWATYMDVNKVTNRIKDSLDKEAYHKIHIVAPSSWERTDVNTISFGIIFTILLIGLTIAIYKKQSPAPEWHIEVHTMD